LAPGVNFIIILDALFCMKVLRTAFLQLQSQIATRRKLRKALWYKKFERKMLIKLTPGLHQFCQN